MTGQRGANARIAVVAIALIAAASACGSSSKDSGANSAPTTTTTPALESAAGKPCVAPPAKSTGTQNVPVEVGPAPTKLVVKDLKVGTGPVIPAGATITANYIGVSCSTGKVFDSSYAHFQAVQFPLTGVIQGWAKGIPGMRVGGTRLLGIPADLAYGSHPPLGSGIAPDEALWFVVMPVKLG